MKTTQEILNATEQRILTSDYAQRQATSRKLHEMNSLADLLTESGLFIPREPFMFAMFGESLSRRGLGSVAQTRINTIATEFGQQRRMHTGFSRSFPPEELHMFDETTKNEFNADGSLGKSEDYSAVRCLIELQASRYLGKIIVPTLAVSNVNEVLHGGEPEVGRSEYTALIAARDPSGVDYDIERFDRPIFSDEIRLRILSDGTHQTSLRRALAVATEAIQAHPDYVRS